MSISHELVGLMSFRLAGSQIRGSAILAYVFDDRKDAAFLKLETHWRE